jgi:hypothetical protein
VARKRVAVQLLADVAADNRLEVERGLPILFDLAG